MTTEDAVHAHDHTAMLAADASGAHSGFSESTRLDGVSTSAGVSGSDISQHASGPGSHNEDGTLEACLRVVAFLNARGGTWLHPERGEAEADWTSESPAQKARLNMQVVRTPTTESFWRDLSVHRSTGDTFDVSKGADILWLSVEKKLSIPPGQRGDIMLVLDANRAPGLAFSSVIDAFRQKYGVRAKAAGFIDIIVAGPDSKLVASLHP